MGKLVNAAQMTVSGAPGTGTVTLGSATTSYVSFEAAGCVDGQTYSYVLRDGSNREWGEGTYSDLGTFTRDTVAGSTNTTFEDLNLTKQSNGFDTAPWYTSSASVVSGQADPLGGTNAFKILDTTDNAQHYIYIDAVDNYQFDPAQAITLTQSVYAKPGDYRLELNMESDTGGALVAFDLSTLQTSPVLTYGSGVSAVVGGFETDDIATGSGGNGWYRIWWTYTASSATGFAAILLLDNGSGTDPYSYTFSGTGTDGVTVYGHMVNSGSALAAYNPTTTAFSTSAKIDATSDAVISITALAADITATSKTDADTVAEFEATEYASTVQSVNILGYRSIGVGAMTVRRVNVEPDHPWKFQSADGGWWEGYSADNTIQPEQLGAYGDKTEDDTAAVQGAIDWAIWRFLQYNAVATVQLVGAYRTTSSLLAFYWSAGAFTFTSIVIEGTGPTYIPGREVGIFCDFLDTPAIIYQAARRSVFRNFVVVGGASDGSPSDSDLINDTGPTPWWNANGARDELNSPYAGICQDPFSVTMPDDGGYPGLSAYYTQNVGSSDVLIEGVEFIGFIVGAAISVSASSQNGDNVELRKCVFRQNKVAIAVGQDQSRGIVANDCLFLYCHCLTDSRMYGKGNGDICKIVGGVTAYAKYLVNGSAGYFSEGMFDRHYAEQVWSFGDWIGATPLNIQNCQIKFWTPPGVAMPNYHLRADAPVFVSGGLFEYYDGSPHALSIAGAARFENVILSGLPVPTLPSLHSINKCFNDFVNGSYGICSKFVAPLSNIGGGADAVLDAGGTCDDPSGVPYNNQLTAVRYGTTSGWMTIYYEDAAITNNGDGTATFTTAEAGYYRVHDALMSLTSWTVADTAKGVFAQTTGASGDGATATITHNLGEVDVGKTVFISGMTPSGYNGAHVVTASSAGSLSFASATTGAQTVAGTIAFDTFNGAGLLIGRVASIVGTTVTLDQVPVSLPSKTFEIYCRRLGTIRLRGTGVITNGSTSVTGVTEGVWRAGHYIFGEGIPNGCRVASASGTNLTLSMNATASATVEIYDAYMTVESAWTTQSAGAPSDRFYRRGEKVMLLDPPAAASGYIQTGYVCTVSGSSPTFAPLYEKTASP